ncbi:hypothetical protein CGMCC3_g998 [Colletotrichum fructicola]|nr:uncharacterized protein CGMCC3_g998 [Colletotrichum fructicola]KAE9583234.1 hypothetical protein CGMCC3_g998 [Colletotrichum fructicola]
MQPRDKLSKNGISHRTYVYLVVTALSARPFGCQ